MPRTGAELLVESLTAAGVRHLFTLSGNQILSVYDAAIGHDIQLIHTRHEALGEHGEFVQRPDDLVPALRRATASGLPACVNVLIDGAAAPTFRVR